MKTILASIFSLAFCSVFAQTKAISFSLIDKRIKTIQSLNPDTLAKKLTSPYKTDTEKVRAIFKWITENIAYDTKAYHNPKEAYEGLWQLSAASTNSDIQKDYNDRIVQKILKERKAICDGYSRLFKTLCYYAKIKCEIITGYIRWASDPIGAMTNRQHAWNAVYINGLWKLIDATWASGYSNTEVTEFTKYYDEFYFFTNPVEFFNDHYPSDNKWSLLPNTPSLYQFYNFPFYYPNFYRFKITSVKPTAGNIDLTRKNRSVQIELEINDELKNIYVYESPYKPELNDTINIESLSEEEIANLYKLKYKIENKRITYLYEVQSDNAEKLNIVYDDKLILTYGIRFQR